MFRYMSFVWNPDDVSQGHAVELLTSRLKRQAGLWRSVFGCKGLAVLCANNGEEPSRTCTLSEGSGVIMGTLFKRTPAPASTPSVAGSQLGESETRRIIATEGRVLLDDYWGRYVAFLFDPASHRRYVVKDPTGRLPCLVTTYRGVSVFFSCMADCVALGLLQFKTNWDYIASRVANGSGSFVATGLENVTELIGGTCVRFDRDTRTEQLFWKPMDIARSDVLEDPEVAALEMRDVARRCAHAWASVYPSMLVRLSGGLDSSIVLGCLRDSPAAPAITCLTYYSPSSRSDERPWARLARDNLQVRHIERPVDTRFEFATLLELQPLAKPTTDFSFLAAGPVERAIAAECGARAIVTGDGGDSHFGRYSEEFAATSYLVRHGLRGRLISIAADVALLRNESAWSVLGKAFATRYARRRQYDVESVRRARRVVREDVFNSQLTPQAKNVHPWFRSTELPCSESEMLSYEMQADLFYDPMREPDAPDPEPVCPLLSQPLAEVCLRIPNYVHIFDGRTRGLARHAFRGVVPQPVLNRQWKDSAQGSTEHLLLRNLRSVRELLLDGILVREKLLDAGALEKALSDTPEREAACVAEILDHLMVEVWLKGWADAARHRIAA